MGPLSTNKNILFGSFFSVVVIIGIVLLLKTSGTFVSFDLASSSIQNGELVSASTKDISLKFTKSLSGVPNISTYPSTNFSTAILDGNKLVITLPNGLQEESSYSLLLSDISSKDGSIIKVLSIYFDTYDDSPAASLKRITPIERSDFSVHYSKINKQFFILSRINNDVVVRSQVSEIFKQYGLDMNDYEVTMEYSSSIKRDRDSSYDPDEETFTGDGAPPVLHLEQDL